MVAVSHTKIPGFVTHVEGKRWWARLLVDGGEYEAEMTAPLPTDMREGNYFTLHQPRRGTPYLYWIRQPVLTKRRSKLARREARELAKQLFG